MTTAQQRQALGTFGEGIAERRLVESGMVVLDRNWRCAQGEIDLVLRDGDTLVICEVKTRRNLSHGHPVEAITPVKATRLQDLAERWRHQRGLTRVGVRIDVVAVLADGRGAADVLHIRGAI